METLIMLEMQPKVQGDGKEVICLPPHYFSKFPGLSPIGHIYLENNWDFPGGLVVKNPPANAGDLVSIPGLGGFHRPWGN